MAGREKRASLRFPSPGRTYRALIEAEFRRIVPRGASILEVGCGTGDLLAALEPGLGVGIDVCSQAIAAARERHPLLLFDCCEATKFKPARAFDYIVLSDLINDLTDVQQVFEHLEAFAHPKTRLVLNFFNHVWYPVIRVAELIGARAPAPPQNWLSRQDVRNLLSLAGWEVLRMDTRILWPLRTPILAALCNRLLAPLFRPFCVSDFIVARPSATRASRELRCSVIVPARNERGNIEAVVARTPEMGAGVEIIFVEGHSADGTWSEIQRVLAARPERAIRAIQQTGTGKGPAVREALELAVGDACFILDADLSVAPEELPKFYRLLRSGTAEMVNGVRLVYPMEGQAMRFLNLVANKFFGMAFSWLLGQPTKDTLCGTKAFLREDYIRISRNRRFFGDFDPFGDFDLLFGAARLNLRILDLPIRYYARTYGQTNIRRWRHGLLLLRMLVFAARRFKFV
jgi:SAM-dependent methyltransferase